MHSDIIFIVFKINIQYHLLFLFSYLLNTSAKLICISNRVFIIYKQTY